MKATFEDGIFTLNMGGRGDLKLDFLLCLPAEARAYYASRLRVRADRVFRGAQSRQLWVAQRGRSRPLRPEVEVVAALGEKPYQFDPSHLEAPGQFREPIMDEMRGWENRAEMKRSGARHLYELADRIAVGLPEKVAA